jgi:ribosomal protein L11 methyltransferase
VGWAALVMELDAADADRLSDRLVEDGAASVSLDDAAAGTADETPLFDEPGVPAGRWPRLQLRFLAPDAAAGSRLLAEACAALSIPVPAVSVEAVAERDWVGASQSQFVPIRVSARLWVVPSWHAPADPGAINLLLDPGLAFGTGSHPTTRLCLEWLEREVHGGERVLDYGCGSGILAIAAMKLGAGEAVGVDIDTAAVESARANAALNAVACEFLDAGQPLASRLPFDLTVANILANPLKLLAPALAAAVRPGGRLALAGLLTAQADEVAACYRNWFEIDDVAHAEGWARLGLARRAP